MTGWTQGHRRHCQRVRESQRQGIRGWRRDTTNWELEPSFCRARYGFGCSFATSSLARLGFGCSDLVVGGVWKTVMKVERQCRVVFIPSMQETKISRKEKHRNNKKYLWRGATVMVRYKWRAVTDMIVWWCDDEAFPISQIWTSLYKKKSHVSSPHASSRHWHNIADQRWMSY